MNFRYADALSLLEDLHGPPRSRSPIIAPTFPPARPLPEVDEDALDHKVTRKKRGPKPRAPVTDLSWSSMCESGVRLDSRPSVPAPPVSPHQVGRDVSNLPAPPRQAGEFTMARDGSENSMYARQGQQKREEALWHGREMSRYFQEAQSAYHSGNGGLAKELSERGKQAQAEVRRLNREAKDLIFNAKNAHISRDNLREIDLHGLSVRESIEVVQEHLQLATSVIGVGARVRIITGAGIHSQGGKAKIKPAVSEWLQRRGYRFMESHGAVDVVLRT